MTIRRRGDHCGRRPADRGGAYLVDRRVLLRATAAEGQALRRGRQCHAPTTTPTTQRHEPRPAPEPGCRTALAPGDCGRSPPSPPAGPPRSSCEACPRLVPAGTGAAPPRPQARRLDHGRRAAAELAAAQQCLRDLPEGQDPPTGKETARRAKVEQTVAPAGGRGSEPALGRPKAALEGATAGPGTARPPQQREGAGAYRR